MTRSAASRKVAAALAGLSLPSTAARSPPRLPQRPRTPSGTGTVTKIADGDTVWVDIAGDGAGPVKVRNAGIQALEIGECGAEAATRRMSQLVLGKKVRLTAQYPSSTASGRPLRFVDVVSSTSVLDVQLTLLQEGLVLWENIKEEPDRSPLYQRAMEDAAAAGSRSVEGHRLRAGSVDLGSRTAVDPLRRRRGRGHQPQRGVGAPAEHRVQRPVARRLVAARRDASTRSSCSRRGPCCHPVAT